MPELGLGLRALWEERDYKACGASMECRGRFILGKLFDRDTRMLKVAWLAAFGTRVLEGPRRDQPVADLGAAGLELRGGKRGDGVAVVLGEDREHVAIQLLVDEEVAEPARGDDAHPL